MKLKTLGKNGRVVLKDYDDRETSSILIERNSYILECTHRYGEDYYREDPVDETTVTYEEITPERILVKDGHFAGVLMMTVYSYTNGYGKTYYNEDKLLITDMPIKSSRDGYNHTTEDHDFYNYTDYRLIERPDGI